jgi:hypothetical protein
MEHHRHHSAESKPADSNLKLAISATWHCLLGCGLGEVAGMIIATIAGLAAIASIVLAVVLGIIGGFALGMVPWLKHGMGYAEAAKKVLIIEGLSIAVMETAEVLTEVYVPGVMTASLAEPIFWLGMLLALLAGFAAALPVNYVFARRGIRHMH